MRTRLLDHKSMAPLGRDCVPDGGWGALIDMRGPPHCVPCVPVQYATGSLYTLRIKIQSMQQVECYIL